MPLDHTQATATISFTGLLLFRVVKEAGEAGKKRCEVKVLECDRHKLDLVVEKITLNAGGVALSSRVVEHGLDLTRDIQIEVEAPPVPEIRLHKSDAGAFDRVNSQDDEDLRWLLDFESIELNSGPITLAPAAGVASPRAFQPTISIDQCTLYTKLKSDLPVAREEIGNPAPAVFLGKVASTIGADLTCGNGSKIVLSNVGPNANPLSLPQEPNVQYRIVIENECDFLDEVGAGSDFRLYYDALTTVNGKKFDLRPVVNIGPGVAAAAVPANFSSTNFPRICPPGGGGTS